MKAIILALTLIIPSLTLYAQQRGDVLKIDSYRMNARKTLDFKGGKNISYIIPKGSIAQILKVKQLPSGNKALFIQIVGGDGEKAKPAWIYYDVKKPYVEVFSQAVPKKVKVQTPDKPKEREVTLEVEEERIEFTEAESLTSDEVQTLEDYDSYLINLLKKQKTTDASRSDNLSTKDFKEKVQPALVSITEISSTIKVFNEEEEEEECADCVIMKKENPLNDIDFMQCSYKNNKLEPKLDDAYASAIKTLGNEINTQDFATTLKCVNGGMKGSTSHAKFAYCKSERSFMRETPKVKTSPCTSKKMVGTVAAELYLAGKCLEIDTQKLLPIFNHESRFYPNILSNTNAAGVGQLTKVAIEDINKNLSKYTKKYGNKPGCEYLNKVGKMHEGFHCARMAVPENPRKNILFSVLYQRMIRDNSVRNPKKSVTKWLKRRNSRITSDQRVQVEEMLARVSYNSGPGAIHAAFDTYAASPTYRNLPFDKFMSNFNSYLKRKVRSEAAGYNPKIIKDAQAMEKKAGVKCSV